MVKDLPRGGGGGGGKNDLESKGRAAIRAN